MATITTPEEYMINVAKKKALTEALRLQSQRWGSMGGNESTVTGQGFRDLPGIQEVNWGGILGNTVGNTMSGRTAGRAISAGTDEETARWEAARKMMDIVNAKDEPAVQAAQAVAPQAPQSGANPYVGGTPAARSHIQSAVESAPPTVPQAETGTMPAPSAGGQVPPTPAPTPQGAAALQALGLPSTSQSSSVTTSRPAGMGLGTDKMMALMALEQLGAPKEFISGQFTKSMSPAAMLQAARDRPSVELMFRSGLIDQGTRDAMFAAIDKGDEVALNKLITQQQWMYGRTLDAARVRQETDMAKLEEARAKMSPGQQKIYDGIVKDWQMATQQAVGIERAIEAANDKSMGTPKSRLEAMVQQMDPTSSIGRLAQSVALSARTGDQIQFDQAMIQSVLADMAKLGGSDSNEELRKIMRQYPDRTMSAEQAVEALKRILEVQKIAIRAKEMEKELHESGQWGRFGTVQPNYYRAAEAEVMGRSPDMSGGVDIDLDAQ